MKRGARVRSEAVSARPGWYVIHPIELLYTLMGPGCEEVTRVSGAGRARWCGPLERRPDRHRARASRPGTGAVCSPEGRRPERPEDGRRYAGLLQEVVKFFTTRVPPVSNEETIEIFAFMDAAQRSKAAGGQPMRLR